MRERSRARRHLVALVAVIVLSWPAARSVAAAAEQVLRPPSPSYRVGGFVYGAPTGAGWRELSASPTTVELVYVEMVSAKKLNSRAHVVVEASKVPEGARVEGGEALARTSLEQQAAARADSLVAKSAVSPVPGDSGFYSYTISSKLKGVDLIEVFYVLLAADRSEYVVVKLATRDADYQTTPYYTDIYASLASFHVPSVGADARPAVP